MDETRLEGRAFARLMDIADAAGRRLLLIVENLHALFDDRQLGNDMGWVVRNRLHPEPRLMVLGTATARSSTRPPGMAHEPPALLKVMALSLWQGL